MIYPRSEVIMVQKFYDSEGSALKEFRPLLPGKISLYYCGATVQGDPHLGHVRSAVVYDQMVRWLRFQGFDVTAVRNVTDIDDKILANARRNNEPWWALAYRNERKFSRMYEALNVLPPTYEPRATSHIPEMQRLIQKLIDQGHAYVADDSSGDVYFDVASFCDYGGLTHQSLDDMQEGDGDSAFLRKRNPKDFALWKGSKPEEPADASWPSPWGSGRPGWHLECSAMSERYLGAVFDIHGGGIDLRFPHHENERAQSKASGAPFAHFWLHHGLITYRGDKMSKSIGNVVDPARILKEHSPLVVRYYLGSAHYRSGLDYHPEALRESGVVVSRIREAMARAYSALAAEAGPPPVVSGTVPKAFRAALEEDMGVPAALAVIHESVRRMHSLLKKGNVEDIEKEYGVLASMLNILGINPLNGNWNNDAKDGLGIIDDVLTERKKLVNGIIDMREEARKSKDWKRSDEIRNLLAAQGISLKDNSDGSTSWM